MSEKDIKYFPEEIYRNDWKTIGTDMRNAIRNTIKTQD